MKTNTITIFLSLILLLLSVADAQAQDLSKKIYDYTAVGGGMYVLSEDGDDVTRHVAERECIETGNIVKFGSPSAQVVCRHDYSMLIGMTQFGHDLARGVVPDPSPDPDPDPVPDPDPAPDPGPDPVGALFYDDFDYVVSPTASRNAPDGPQQFVTRGGWAGFKDLRTSNPGAGGLLYTVDSIPGHSGRIPTRSGRALAMHGLLENVAPEVIPGVLRQTDFYLQLGSEGSPNGTIPANVWFQFKIFINDTGAEVTELNEGKFLYPNRTAYPGSMSSVSWLYQIRRNSGETDGNAWRSIGERDGAYLWPEVFESSFANASEFPTNEYKLGPNQSGDHIPTGRWMEVRIHYDASGPRGTYEQWHREVGGDWVKVSEWISGVTPGFTWNTSSGDRQGHRQLRMPTTWNYRMDHGSGGDIFMYIGDFLMAGSEAALQ